MSSSSMWMLLLALISYSLPGAQAQVFTGPVSTATGGAGRAAVDPNEVAFLNPAAVAHLKTYYASVNYGLGTHNRFGNSQQYGVHLADGTGGNVLPGSFSYQRRRIEGAGGFTDNQQDFQLGIAGFPLQRVTFGLAAHRLSDQLDDGREFVQYNGHAGVLFTPNENMGFALTVHDFVQAAESVPAALRTMQTWAIGSNFVVLEFFRARLDITRPDVGGRNNVMMGIETYFRHDFAFRVGGNWLESRDQTFFSTGIGFKGPRLSFNYTFQKDARTAEGIRHLFDLWMPL